MFGLLANRSQESEAVLDMLDDIHQQYEVERFRCLEYIAKMVGKILSLASTRLFESVRRNLKSPAPCVWECQAYSAYYFTRSAPDFRDGPWRDWVTRRES